MNDQIRILMKELQDAFCGLCVTRVVIDPEHWAFENIEQLAAFANSTNELIIMKINDLKYEAMA